MNAINNLSLYKANEEAIYNTYAYLTYKTTPIQGETLRSIIQDLEAAHINDGNWGERDIHRLNILKNAVYGNASLADAKISNLTRSNSGLTAFSFTKPNGDISVVFRGTGDGEWIDNGEGLSGIPEENTYITFDENGKVINRQTVKNDFATDQQVEALNWFNSIAAKNDWNKSTKITVSGHSKGGNKAQFVAIRSELVDDCFSFDGQGFSPEALTALREQLRVKYEERRHNIRSFSADNDYVNVLGERLVPEKNIYYFKSHLGFHYIEAILDNNGRFYPQCEQGKLSKYMETVSKEIMRLKPAVRQYATLGVMNIFQKYLGSGIPVNGDAVSTEKTIAGLIIAVGSLLHNLREYN